MPIRINSRPLNLSSIETINCFGRAIVGQRNYYQPHLSWTFSTKKTVITNKRQKVEN